MTNVTFTALGASGGLYQTLPNLEGELQALQDQIDALDGDVAFTSVDQSFETRTAAAAASIAGAGTTINVISTGGYAAPGDGGGARWKYAAVQSSGDGKFESADGAFWEYVLGPGGVVNAAAFGVLDTGAAVTSQAQECTDFADGLPILLSDGTIRIGTITGASTDVWFIGAGKDKTTLLLATTGTDTMLDVAGIRLEKLTQSDGGRSSMDHTANSAVYLNECTGHFIHEDVTFLTDRSVVLFVADPEDEDALWRAVRTHTERATTPVSGEEDDTNVFTVLDVRNVDIDWFTAEDIRGRSLINVGFDQETGSTRYNAMASIEHLGVDVFGRSDASDECKCVFVQGAQTKIDHAAGKDVFGRFIDIVGNDDPVVFTTRGNVYPSSIRNLRVDYSAANASHPGAANDEPGCIYIRYPGGITIDAYHLDFTGRTGLASSNLFSAIALRHLHASKHAHIGVGSIIAPFANAIAVDISDTTAVTETWEPNVTIDGPSIEAATNGSRKPVNIQNDSATKLFGNVVIENVLCDYSADTFIEVDKGALARTATSVARYMRIEGNRETTSGALDKVDFQQFPERLLAPNTDVSVLYAASNGAGAISDLEDMLRLISTYAVRKITLGLATSITSEQTADGTGLSLTPPRPGTEVVINGDNGASGTLTISAAGTIASAVSFTLKGNEVTLNNVRLKLVDTGSGITGSLLITTGPGHIQVNTPDWDDAAVGMNARGTDFTISGGTIDAMSTTIVNFQGKRQARGTINGVTGAGNANLVRFSATAGDAPCTLVYGSGGTGGVTSKSGAGVGVLQAAA